MKVFVTAVVLLILGGLGMWLWMTGSHAPEPAATVPASDSGPSPAAPAGAPLVSQPAGRAGAGRSGPPTVPVRVVRPEPRRFETVLESLGTAQANESITVTASVTGTVIETTFRDGEEVVAGQVLLRLASAEEFADRREVAVALADQQRELERIQGLIREGLVPRQQVEQQRSRVEELEARLAAVDARIADRVIRAPFAGVLGLRRVSTGSLITPGSAIVDLDDISVIKVDFTVPERFLGAIRSGMPIEARSVAFPDRVYRGAVTATSSRIDVATRSLTVRASIDNAQQELRPGMLLTTRLSLAPVDRLAVPEGALVALGDQNFVFVVGTDNRVQRQPVRIGRRQPGFVEILEGLDTDHQVVSEGTLRLRPGVAVRVLVGDPES